MNMMLVYTLFARGDRNAAMQHFALIAREVMRLRAPPVEVGRGSLLQTVLARHRCLLMSAHGTFLAYDMNSRQVRLEAQVFGRSDLFPVFAQWSDGASSFCVLSNGGEIQVAFDIGDAASDVAPTNAATSPVMGEDEADCLVLRGGDAFLSAGSNGRLQFSAALGDLERFVPIPMPDQSSVLKAGSLNWFDQVMLTQPPPALAAAVRQGLIRSPRPSGGRPRAAREPSAVSRRRSRRVPRAGRAESWCRPRGRCVCTPPRASAARSRRPSTSRARCPGRSPWW